MTLRGYSPHPSCNHASISHISIIGCPNNYIRLGKIELRLMVIERYGSRQNGQCSMCITEKAKATNDMLNMSNYPNHWIMPHWTHLCGHKRDFDVRTIIDQCKCLLEYINLYGKIISSHKNVYNMYTQMYIDKYWNHVFLKIGKIVSNMFSDKPIHLWPSFGLICK